MRARLKVSRAGVDLIKSFEGLRTTAARLPDGRWTLGYGHTFSAREGATATQEDADALLRFDLLPVADAINNVVLVPINQNQFDALVSFCFNIGVDNFAQSTVLKRINEGRMTEAALAMDAWRSAEFNGQTYVLAPLIRRRAAEKNLFLTPDEVSGNAPTLLVRPVEDAGQSASPAEVDAPDRNGILSARPLGSDTTPVESLPSFEISATPAPVQPVERQVIDLASFAPRNAEPEAASVARDPSPIEHLPVSVPVDNPPTAYEYDTRPAISPEIQAAIARAQEDERLSELRRQEQQAIEQRMREEALRQAEMLASARAQEEARQREEALRREDARRLEFERLEASRLEQARAEEARLEVERLERERTLRDEMVRAELARLEAARSEQERLERERAEMARLHAEQLERERQEAVQKEIARLEAERAEGARQEAARHEAIRLEAERLDRARTEAARVEALRLETERAEAARLDAERLESERINRERAELLRAEEARREAERLEAERAEAARIEAQRQAREQAAAAPSPDIGQPTDEAEKARKAEAAAALMRLYSPYGGGGLGRPLTPVAPQAPKAEPQAPAAPLLQVVPQADPAPVLSVEDEADDEVEEVQVSEKVSFAFKPAASPSHMAPPQVTALNPYARPVQKAEETVVEVPRPAAADLSAQPEAHIVRTPEIGAARPAENLNWREQLQRPLPADYQAQATASPAQAAQSAQAAAFEDTFDTDDNWINSDGRVALSAEDGEGDSVSLWRMIQSTFWPFVVSVLGVGFIGVAAGSYWKATQDSVVIRGGQVELWTWISLGSASAGITLIFVAVWLIMKRLGGLQD